MNIQGDVEKLKNQRIAFTLAVLITLLLLGAGPIGMKKESEGSVFKWNETTEIQTFPTTPYAVLIITSTASVFLIFSLIIWAVEKSQ